MCESSEKNGVTLSLNQLILSTRKTQKSGIISSITIVDSSFDALEKDSTDLLRNEQVSLLEINKAKLIEAPPLHDMAHR